MTNHTSTVLRVAAFAAVGAFSASALAADGRVTYLEAAGSSDRPLVVAASDRGIVLIGADNAVFRAYHHQQVAPPGVTQAFLWVEDIDGDGRDEFVGAGLPSFVVDDNGDPIWGVLDGCDQYFVGDFIDDRNHELLCIRGTTVQVWSYDGQEYFNWTGAGYSVSGCFGDDFDDDRKQEVACALTNGNHLFFDVEDWFNDPTYEPEREGPAPEALNAGGVDRAPLAAVAAGEQALRVDGREVTLSFAGGSVQLAVGDAPVTASIGGTGIYSAIAADLDRDGRSEIYIGGDDAVHVLRLDGTVLASIPANPSAMRRDARVTVRSATANGLENSDRDAVGAIVEQSRPSIVSCYANRMGADQFTRVGTMLWELTVNDSGRVSNVTKRHSGLRNGSLESCVQGVLESMRFSPATGGDGSVSLSLEFDFVDVP